MFKLPTKEEIERIRKQYPAGTIVELVRMDDPQAPPKGTRGTVRYVDDMGGIGIRWENGSGLKTIPGEDVIRKIPRPGRKEPA